jgi:hypothetical protein
MIFISSNWDAVQIKGREIRVRNIKYFMGKDDGAIK